MIPGTDFQLDPRLEADTFALAEWPLCRVLLMNDARFPWLILVPRQAGLTDIDQLAAADRLALWDETTRAMHVLRQVAAPDKINLGALGNIVRQLHMHVVARKQTDAAWPGPVWSAEPAQPYAPDERATLCRQIGQAMHTRV